jgi:ligand-binding sensor domain-containing protein
VKPLLLSLCWCLGWVLLSAQTPVTRAVGEESGLSSSEIFDLHQDRKGYLWVSSSEGLFRYNGDRFVPFSNPRFRGIAVSGLREDAQGRIWCHSFRGHIFFVQGDSLALFDLPKGVMHVSFVQFVLDSTDHVWLTANDAIYEIDPISGLYTRHRPNLQGTKFLVDNLLTVAPDNTIWACANNEWCQKTPSGWRYFFHPPEMRQHGAVNLFFLEKKILATKHYQNRTSWFELGRDGFRPLQVEPRFAQSKVYKIVESADRGLFWMLTNSGAWLVDEHLVVQRGKSLLEKKSVSDMLIDREGLSWLSTLQAGLFQFPDLGIVGYGGRGNTDGWPESEPTALESDGKERLFVGYQDGLILFYRPATGQKESWRTNEALAVESLGYHPETDVLWQAQLSIHRRPVHHGVWRNMGINNGCKSFTPLPGGMMGMAGSSNYLILFDGGDSSWVNRFGRTLPSYTPEKRWQFSKGRCWTAWEDTASGYFLVAYNDSLIAFKGAEAQKLILPDGSGLMVRSLAQTADGTLWVGSVNKGLLSFRGNRMTGHWWPETGFPANNIRALLADGPYLWAATEKALLRLDWSNGRYVEIDRLDGLPTVQIQQMALVGHTLYLLTAKGLVSIDTRADYQNAVPPMIYLSGVQINDRDTLILPDYHLSWDQRGILLRFDVLAFRSGREFALQYRLLGHDTAWATLPNGETSLNLSGLNPGSYQVEIRALNEDGQPSSASIHLPIRIRVPFWLEGWFLLLGGALLVGLSYALYRFRIGVLRRRDRLENELRASKLAALRAQMNPHFMFNSLNSIQEFVLINDKRSANLYLSKFASLMRLILDHSNKDLIPLDEEILLLRLYLDLESMRFDGRIETMFQFEPQLSNQGIQLPSMIVQPFVENAFKHGLLHKEGPGKLRLALSLQQPDTLRVEVEDDGVGRKRAQSIQAARPKYHESFSTGAAHTRLALLNLRRSRKIGVVYEDLEDENGNALGTRVILLLPIQSLSSKTP